MSVVVAYPRAVSITKSDTVNIQPQTAQLTDAIYVGGAGIVAVVLQDDNVVRFTCIAAQLLPIKAKRVNSTNTTATLMIALYY